MKRVGKKIFIAPSILAANHVVLAQEAKRVEKAGADMLHVDIMDGRFVPRIVFSVETVKAMRKATRLPLDVHLMIAEPWKSVAAFAKAGAKRICVHTETGSAKQLLETLKLIKKSKCKAGIALNPTTPLSAVNEKIFRACDYAMPMTVVPGAAGQAFMHSVVPKFKALQQLLKRLRLRKEIEADGGVSEETAPLVARGGATVLVAGAAVFSALDARVAIKRLRESAAKRL